MQDLKPDLSVIAIFYNMQREAERTLHSLSRQYQNPGDDFSFEVIAIDNGSGKPLSSQSVEAHGKEFRHIDFNTQSPSPVDAINHGAKIASGKYLMVLIDGARILSPGIYNAVNTLAKAYENPFIYTLGLHLGPDLQNRSILEGYNQTVEDELLAGIDWKQNGYDLFTISALAGSCIQGFTGYIAESNCFVMPRKSYSDLGGMNPAFQTPGGGLVNLNFFEKACHSPTSTPVMLLGEGTFHQFHGGVATNVKMEEHPMEDFQREYKNIYGKPWELNKTISPVYFGGMPAQARPFLFVDET